ncbi:MAG TPA: aromatic ring-hydroxylating dioxygenase subunit alpha [Hyphomicrobiales bacterium]|nr:aromatic ring-hydroxylating dioxygenase subunit alpha [Hyphomicrobiales bacterium]
MEASFLRDQWYVAATSAEIAAKPLARTICNENLVLFRRADGRIAVLEDRCPHRQAPLSLGEVVGDDIQCGYHGVRFRGDGACTLIPSQTDLPIPRNFSVRAYAAEEIHGLAFVWIGDAAKADRSLIPDWSANTSPDFTTVHGYHYVRANYMLLVDNLLDLTHLTYVHKATLAAGPSGHIWLKDQDVTVEGEAVHTSRTVRGAEPSGLIRATRRFVSGQVDRFQTSDFYPPCFVRVTLGAEAAGEADAMKGPHHVVLNAATPETEATTHYFWSVPRAYALGEEAVSEIFYGVTKAAFDEDAAMIEAQQRTMATDPNGGKLVNFRGDLASQAARRIMDRKLREQAMKASVAAE